LPAGAKITSIRGRSKKQEDIEVPAGMEPYTFPLALLISGKSASGSEVVAAALQDHGRAVIVGEPSYGKGLVQSVYPIFGGNGLALTTAYYYTPKGRSIQRRYEGAQIDAQLNPAAAGVQPDITAGPERVTRLRAFLDGSGLITAFATEWLTRNPKPTPGFTLPRQVLDQYQVWLGQRNVLPTLAEWSIDRDWIHSRLEQEVLNLGLGVEYGDEVEARRDPQVRRALSEIESRNAGRGAVAAVGNGGGTSHLLATDRAHPF
jgi:carboxyl-terminal processing protease